MDVATAMTPADSVRRRFGPWRTALNSLQFKASALVILLVLLVLAVGFGLSLRLASETVARQSLDHARAMAESLAGSASNAIAAGDAEGLVKTVNQVIRSGGVAYLAFSDQRGRILASGEAAGGLLGYITSEGGRKLKLDPVLSPRVIRDPFTGLTCIDMAVPVYADQPLGGPAPAGPDLIGYVRMATAVSGAEASVQQMGGRLQRVAVGMLLLVASCSVVAMRKVVGPLNELARTARQLAGGIMDARAKVTLHNEIGDLARAFNEMADRLAGAQFEMLKLNAELEERVQQRTRELEDLASREPLTGLYNRRFFSEVSTREFAAAERYDADLTVLMFDLDHFKETNDRFGHRTGDEVLVLVADAIRSELRESDVAARFGGDEFILLLPRTSASAAGNAAERISSRFMESLRRESPDVPTTLSIGVASLRVTRARSAEALIHEADVALYAAKMGGRNRTMTSAGVVTAVR